MIFCQRDNFTKQSVNFPRKKNCKTLFKLRSFCVFFKVRTFINSFAKFWTKYLCRNNRIQLLENIDTLKEYVQKINVEKIFSYFFRKSL